MKMLISTLAIFMLAFGFAGTAKAQAQDQGSHYYRYGERARPSPPTSFNGQREYSNNGYNGYSGGYDPYYLDFETSGGRTKVERDPGRRQQYCRANQYGPAGWVAYGKPCPSFRITQYPDGRIVRELVSGQ